MMVGGDVVARDVEEVGVTPLLLGR
ncbi:hypothetical protein AGR3A_pa50001 [Agrobacterium tomkonis CFBP 6623]|uniref:Uncharacterized protein n=1 Tax=Agrobacterium tomkonis CFBP 6623 TaxID=1183432 RepID=A0A1S7S9Q7_9HYPH|nr:hypothetical protein AGR3A_pa50001 [Agrobacterium tomkonis CFBP 6623]